MSVLLCFCNGALFCSVNDAMIKRTLFTLICFFFFSNRFFGLDLAYANNIADLAKEVLVDNEDGE